MHTLGVLECSKPNTNFFGYKQWPSKHIISFDYYLLYVNSYYVVRVHNKDNHNFSFPLFHSLFLVDNIRIILVCEVYISFIIKSWYLSLRTQSNSYWVVYIYQTVSSPTVSCVALRLELEGTMSRCRHRWNQGVVYE